MYLKHVNCRVLPVETWLLILSVLTYLEPLFYMSQNKTKNKQEGEMALEFSLEFCLKLVIYRHLLETDYILGDPQDGAIFGYRATGDISDKKMFISFPI